jgi:hypothetical protein
VSGAKASRPGLNRLMEDAWARTFEVLLVWKLDRFGRSLVDCLNNIQELERYRVRFIAVTQNLDTNEKNPASRFLLHVLGAAEFERSLIREGTQAGQQRYQPITTPVRAARPTIAAPGKTFLTRDSWQPCSKPSHASSRCATSNWRGHTLWRLIW